MKFKTKMILIDVLVVLGLVLIFTVPSITHADTVTTVVVRQLGTTERTLYRISTTPTSVNYPISFLLIGLGAAQETKPIPIEKGHDVMCGTKFEKYLPKEAC